jgi:hypothetical protein
MKELRAEIQEGVKIGGTMVTALRFADDKFLRGKRR